MGRGEVRGGLAGVATASDDKRMLARTSGRLAMFWHGSGAPSDLEWDRHLGLLGAQAKATLRVLVFTEGGAPSPGQQIRLAKVLGGLSLPVAVVSDLGGIRFVASALALFLKRLRTFTVDEREAGYAHLELTPSEREAAEAFFVEVTGGR